MMIMAAFLPLLTLTHIEGLLFRPMALTILFALSGSMIFSLIVVPVLASYAFRRGYSEWENPRCCAYGSPRFTRGFWSDCFCLRVD